MGIFERLWGKLNATAGRSPAVHAGTLPPAPTQVKTSDFVSDAGDVPRVVMAMLERNGNVLVESRQDAAPTGEPCTVHVFRDPLMLSAAQHRFVKKYLTRCNPGRPMDRFEQLCNGRQGDRFVWLGSEDEQDRRAAEALRSKQARDEQERAFAVSARTAAAVRAGLIPARKPPLSLPASSASGLGPSPDCEELDILLEALGVGFLVNALQPDDVTFRLLDRDVLLPRSLFEKLYEASGSIPEGDPLSITRLWRHWDCYAVADDRTYAEHVLDGLEKDADPLD